MRAPAAQQEMNDRRENTTPGSTHQHLDEGNNSNDMNFSGVRGLGFEQGTHEVLNVALSPPVISLPYVQPAPLNVHPLNIAATALPATYQGPPLHNNNLQLRRLETTSANSTVLGPVPSSTTTPWTLGSTDGMYAIGLVLRQYQDYQQRLGEAGIAGHAQKFEQQYTVPSLSQSVYEEGSSTAGGGSHGVAIAHDSGKLSLHSGSNENVGAASLSSSTVGATIPKNILSGNVINVVPSVASSSIAPSTQSHYSESSAETAFLPPRFEQTNANTFANTTSVETGLGFTAARNVQTGAFGEYVIDTAGSSENHFQAMMSTLTNKQSLYQDRLFRQPSASVESVLAASCEVMGFDIAEMWLRTGHKTHQLTNSHLRPTALEDSVRRDLVDVYYGDKSSERTHRLSPALCKRAKEANDIVWVTANNQHGVEALRCSISNVRTAVAVPICHEASNTNITIIYFSIRRILVKPTSVEFLVHMALASGVASVNSLAGDGLIDRDHVRKTVKDDSPSNIVNSNISHSEHVASQQISHSIRHHRPDQVSVTGALLNLQWRQLINVEYLTDGGNSWIHTAVFEGKPVVVKTLKPECQDVALAINEIEGELAIHSRLHQANIVSLIGAGTTSKGVRFMVLERLDGGTLSQMLGYDTRIRDRRRRFWRKKHFSFVDLLRIARSIAQALTYCHEECIPGCMILHRDLKPDNIGFTLDGTVKILDFGLAKIIENASIDSDEVYAMSGETGSLRYMAPEVADALPYNAKADVYSFGIILWELNTTKKPFDGLNREMFYERVVHGGERPPLHRKWPKELTSLMTECWDADMANRPKFRDIVVRLDAILNKEKGGQSAKSILPKLSGLYNRHSTWF